MPHAMTDEQQPHHNPTFERLPLSRSLNDSAPVLHPSTRDADDSSALGDLGPISLPILSNNDPALQTQTSTNSWEHRRQRSLDALTAASIRTKNRRREYLGRNPKYFEGPDLELADPLQYDRCIRRFQSAAEREADGKMKGWSGVLEADLYRSEAKIAALQSAKSAAQETASEEAPAGNTEGGEDAPSSKEEGIERWKYTVTMRFLQGLDPDFSYKEVDENDDLDEIEYREAQDRWFEEEEPEWVDSLVSSNPVGETGIQDF